MKNKCIIIFLVIILGGNFVYTQTQKAENTPQQQPPIELMRLMIEGVERVNVKAGSKQMPSPQTKLSESELDSLNPLEKQPSLLIPPQQLPKALSFPVIPSAFIQGDFGLFSTFDIFAGYRYNVEGYELYGKAGIEESQGDIKNSEYTKFSLNINSDYIAPEYFWIFGGSRTRTKLTGNVQDYKLYGTDSANARDGIDLDLSLESKGNFEGIVFSTGGSLSTLQLTDKDSKFFENRIRGFLKANKMFEHFSLGTTIDLNFGNWSGKELSIHQILGRGELYYERMTLEGEIGHQFATNSKDEIQSMPTLRLGLSYLPNLDFSVRAEFFTGLDKSFAKDYYQQNPYFDLNSQIIFSRASAIIKGNATYAPDVRKSATISASLNFYENYPIFNSIIDGVRRNEIELLFETANIIKLSAEGFWEFTETSSVNLLLGTNIAMMDYQSNAVPYMPKIYSTLSYRIKFLEKAFSEIGIIYNSSRYADKNNKNELNSYFNLFAKLEYQLIDNLAIKIEMNNLTGNDNFLWKAYREYGLFGKIGVLWQF